MNKEEKRVHMHRMISDWRSSGKNKKQYCAEKGVSSSTFYYWFSHGKATMEVSGDFVELSKINRHGAEVEITYPNGVKLKVGANLSLLSQLIRLY